MKGKIKMSTLKCKMCGGTLEINENETTATCEYCGTEQTIPKITDDVIGNLFNRANTLRLKSEFDKAEEIYNKIVGLDNTQSEAYWGIILCKYGIEYVEDPTTYKRVPTCHRTSYDAITADEDYKLAIQYADISQKIIYEAEAKAIDEIQKGILTISQNEKPYDVFICYKETDESGKRTQDSVLANDIYHQLTQEGFKVFYAAITLEDKLGQEYEPYIFAALNSAKVMLVIGSKPEYFTAVWVKNEWSRYLKLMKADRSKLLIPCYKDMDAYELPEEFAHLQAQDMGKIGFINDIVRGIKKVINKDEPKSAVKETAAAGQAANSGVAPLLKRISLFLEDGNWQEADEYCERVLDSDPENAQAYLYKLMAKLEVKKVGKLKGKTDPFDKEETYQKIMRFADEDLKNKLNGYIKFINDRNEKAKLKRTEMFYQMASRDLEEAVTEEDYKKVAKEFEKLYFMEYKDSVEKYNACIDKLSEYEKAWEDALNAIDEIKTALKQLGQYRQQKKDVSKKVLDYEKDNIEYDNTETKINELIEIRNNLNKDIDDINHKISDLDSEYNSLGLFAVSRKRQIKALKEELSAKSQVNERACNRTEQDILKWQRILNSMQKHSEDIESEKTNLKAITEKLETILDNIYNCTTLNPYVLEILLDKNSEFVPVVSEIYNYKDFKKFFVKDQYIGKITRFERIDWRILAIEDDEMLLITDDVIAIEPYVESLKLDATWENSSIRLWLNSTFLNKTFDSEEQERIVTTKVATEELSKKDSRYQNYTYDKIFLLSISEVESYFADKNDRKCIKPSHVTSVCPSPAEKNGKETCYWWLRGSSGSHDGYCVDCWGDIIDSFSNGGLFEITKGERGNGVRPAMWISLSDGDIDNI